MTATAILAELRLVGIAPALRGDGIAVPAGRLTDAQRQAIRQHRSELLEIPRTEAANEPAEPDALDVALAPAGAIPTDGKRVRAVGPIAIERYDRGLSAERFDARIRAFTARGIEPDDAEALAYRLAQRDRDQDDRRMCVECSYLGGFGRCLAAASGKLPGASPRLEPVPTILQRCEAFGLRKGLV